MIPGCILISEAGRLRFRWEAEERAVVERAMEEAPIIEGRASLGREKEGGRGRRKG